MQQKIKELFYNQEGKPRWEVIVPIVALLGFMLWYYFKVLNYAPPSNCDDNGQPKDKGNSGNNGSNGNGNTTGYDGLPTEVSVVRNYQEFANQLHVTNTKYYNFLMGCSGNDLPGERCWNFKEFLKMNEETQRLVANIYKEKFGKSLYEDVDSIYVCDCMEWSGTLTGRVKKRLETLGMK